MTQQIAIIKTPKALNAEMTAFQIDGQSLQQRAHILAVSVLWHVNKYHDSRLADRMVESLPDIARKNALRQWFLDFAELSYDDVNGVFVYDNAKKPMLQDAIDTPFWKHKPEAKFVPYDLVKGLTTMLKTIERSQKKGQSFDPAVIRMLQDVKRAADKQEATAPVVDATTAAVLAA